MHSHAPSASHLAAALVALLVVATPAMAGPLSKSVGEIVVDAQGRATGQNVAGVIGEATGTIGGFRVIGSGTTIFRDVSIDGFEAAERIAGSGSSTVTLRGTNAIVSLHDNLHSMMKVRATQPTTVIYGLAPDISASPSPTERGVVRLSQGAREVGSLVAIGDDGPRSRGEVLTVQGTDVIARLQAGSELIFLARPPNLPDANYQDALIAAHAEGALVSHYITEFGGSDVATSQVDTDPFSVATTDVDAAGYVQTALAARPKGPTLLVYDLAYETLAATHDGDVSVYLDGELAQRASDARDVLALAKEGIAAFYAHAEGGRTRVITSGGEGGDHRIVITVGAQASTEPQARAESESDGNARVYGDFQYHANGKLTGSFLTSVLPEGHARLLGFTALASRTEIFRDVAVDGGASASFHASGLDELRLESAHSDLTLVDDVYATMILAARAPEQATYELAAGIRATQPRDDLILLEGPRGSVGALLLLGSGGLAAEGQLVRAHLDAGASVVFRGAPDAHASEAALLDALTRGQLGAQFLAGVHEGTHVAKVTSYSRDVGATIRAAGTGALQITYLAQGNAARAFALDTRGAALAAQVASDIRVTLDGIAIASTQTAEDALAEGGSARYFAEASLEGALRILVNTASGAGETATVTIESTLEAKAQAQSRTDAFGAFRLFHDGAAVGNFVTLKVDRAAGAISDLATVAMREALVASLAAGRTPYASVSGEGASVLRLENRDARIEVSDTTNAFVKIIALTETDAAFRLAEGLHVTSPSPGILDITSGDGRAVGSLVASRAATLEARGAGDIRAHMLAGGEIVFRTHEGIERELSDAQRHMINEAIADGRVAAHVLVQHGTSSAATTYGDVEISTSATQDRVHITIDSATEAGKTLLVSLDPNSIPGMARGHALIRFDGALAREASSYADVLDASDDAGAAEYFVLAGDAGTQVLVSIPHFSVHTVTLEQREGGSSPLYMYATILLGLLVIVESVLLARNARKNKLIQNERRP